jgi:hypothetical protein
VWSDDYCLVEFSESKFAGMSVDVAVSQCLAARMRYVLVRLSLRYPSGSHANLVVIDVLDWKAWHFEPHGNSGNKLNYRIVVDGISAYLSKQLKKPLVVAPMTKGPGPQALENGSEWQKRLPFGSIFGKCLAWCMMIGHIIIHRAQPTDDWHPGAIINRFVINQNQTLKPQIAAVLMHLYAQRIFKTISHPSSSKYYLSISFIFLYQR